MAALAAETLDDLARQASPKEEDVIRAALAAVLDAANIGEVTILDGKKKGKNTPNLINQQTIKELGEMWSAVRAFSTAGFVHTALAVALFHLSKDDTGAVLLFGTLMATDKPDARVQHAIAKPPPLPQMRIAQCALVLKAAEEAGKPREDVLVSSWESLAKNSEYFSPQPFGEYSDTPLLQTEANTLSRLAT